MLTTLGNGGPPALTSYQRGAGADGVVDSYRPVGHRVVKYIAPPVRNVAAPAAAITMPGTIRSAANAGGG